MYQNKNQVEKIQQKTQQAFNFDELIRQIKSETVVDSFDELNGNPISRKLFISEIQPEIRDHLMESVLSACGKINSWKRNKDLEGNSVSFGIVEFTDVLGMLNAIRILSVVKIFDNFLRIKIGEKNQRLIQLYFQKQKEQKIFETDSDIVEQLTKDDEMIKEKIELLLKKYTETNQYQEVKEISYAQKYTEEKLQLQKQKYGLISQKELNEKFQGALKKYLKEESAWLRNQKQYRNEDQDYERQQKLKDELHFKETSQLRRFLLSEKEQRYRERRKKQWEEDLKFQEQKEVKVDVIEQPVIQEESLPQKIIEKNIQREDLKNELLKNPEKLKILLKLREKVQLPVEKLFKTKIKWTHLKSKNIFDEKMRKFLETKSIEMFTVIEESFITLVKKLLEEQVEPQFIVQKLEKILDEDTEQFVVELWQFILFEQFKIKYKIIQVIFQKFEFLFQNLIDYNAFKFLLYAQCTKKIQKVCQKELKNRLLKKI